MSKVESAENVPGQLRQPARPVPRLSPPVPRPSYRIPRTFLVLLAYLLGAIVFTWPLITNLGGQVINGGDSWQTTWDFWLLKHSLIDLQTWPLQTNLVYWPNGATLYAHTYSLDLGLLLLPLTILAGPLLTYNFASLFVCVATGYAMYLLARSLSGNGVAGFVAGFAVTFSAWHVTRLWGQLSLASLQWPLLYMFFLLRRQGRPWVNMLGAGLALALTVLAGPYLVLDLALFTALWALNRGLERRVPWRQRLSPLARAVGAGVVGLVVTAPLLLGALSAVGSGKLALPTFAETLTFSADPLAYLVPGQYSTVFGDLFAGVNQHLWGTIPLEKMVFPGWSLWALGLYGLVRAWPQTRLWFNLLLVSLVLSLGPVLHVGGQGMPVPLPYLALYLLPGLEVARTPVRFGVLVLIALAVLAAYGLADLLRRLAHGATRLELVPSPTQGLELRVPSVKAPLLVAGVLALITAEQWIIPLPVATAEVPAFYQQLARDPVRTALLEVPLGDPDPSPNQSVYLFYQTVHQQPIVGGYLSRTPIDPFIEGSPGVYEFKYPNGPPSIVTQATAGTRPVLAAAARALLQANEVRYIVLHKKLLNPEGLAATDQLASQITDGYEIYNDDDLRVYGVIGTPDPAQVVVQLGPGWLPVGQGPPGRTGRWADQGADVWITAFQPETLGLEITATWAGAPRPVQVRLNGVPRMTWSVGAGSATYQTGSFLVPAGVSHLTLVSASPAIALPGLTPFDKNPPRAILQATQIRVVDVRSAP